MKFGRSYQLTATGTSGVPIDIGFPLTIDFTVTHNLQASANSVQVSLYGLSYTNRSELVLNQYNLAQLYPLTLRAGYASQQPLGLLSSTNSLPIIFDGFAHTAYTERNGSELITRISGIDNGDLVTGKPAGTFDGGSNSCVIPADTSLVEAVSMMSKHLTGNVGFNPKNFKITPPAKSPFVGKPTPCVGSVWGSIQDLINGSLPVGTHVYVDSNQLYVVGQNDTLSPNNLGVLSASSGLLGIPKYTGSTIMCSCIFEPALKIGSYITLDSRSNKAANGLRKIVAYTHHGTISGAESGELTSDIELQSLDIPLGLGR